MELGGFLVQDKAKLSEWLRGIQTFFAQLYFNTKRLVTQATELLMLKEFLGIKVE